MAEATIVYHQGTATVTGFDHITEMDNMNDIRVWYNDNKYDTYHNATIIDVTV
jgi:hypothetical protein